MHTHLHVFIIIQELFVERKEFKGMKLKIISCMTLCPEYENLQRMSEDRLPKQVLNEPTQERGTGTSRRLKGY